MPEIVNPYLLLTPGPLSTSPTVKEAMLKDWCTWDNDYNEIVQDIREKLTKLATDVDGYTSVLMQGSGTFSVEATLGSCIPKNDKLLILVNGAYGERIAKIADVLDIQYRVIKRPENQQFDSKMLDELLASDATITHVAMVHCETTTGMLNPLDEIASIIKKNNRVFILDAMSSFGGIPIDMDKQGIDVLISSANKCIQGVPGFGFIILKKSLLEKCKGNARSLSLDVYDQWETMEKGNGKWRYTSPTHTVRAFHQALRELELEGGVSVRHERYDSNQQALVKGMLELGFECYLPSELHSPIITSFLYPSDPDFSFDNFYQKLKNLGFVIYPGKVTDTNTLRIGNIGHVFYDDIDRLLKAIQQSIYWK